MNVTETSTMHGPGLKTPERNRYFYGKLLDAYHFDLETGYFNAKRWLLNRLVSGYGVICGLGVQLGDDKRSVRVLPGVALDKWGREIIVPELSKPVELPEIVAVKGEQAYPHCPQERFVHVLLCYHECETGPVPVLAGDCNTVELCAAGIIRERYKIVIKEGKAPEVHMECSIPDLISGDRISYQALALWVTGACPALPADPCIPLANVRVPEAGNEYDADDIDITVRPIVYTNDLLFEIMHAMTGGERSHPRGGKS